MPERTDPFFHTLSHHLRHGRVVLLGIGNPDRGDDGLGPVLARRLSDHPHLHSIVCDEMPENYTGEVKLLKPTCVVLIDAVDFHGDPGEGIVLRAQDLRDDRFSSHKPSLAVLMNYLQQETSADVILFGIQPAQRGFREGLSPEVEAGVFRMLALFERITLSIEKEKY